MAPTAAIDGAADAELGQHADVIGEVRSAIGGHPLRERLRGHPGTRSAPS
ncbi:BTAD domain-containing putative transcriptional regulator [Streptomyces sp. NPDC054952]